MQIRRSQSRLTFRKRRRSGCASFILIPGLLAAMSVLTWMWLSQRIASVEMPHDDSMSAALQAFNQGDLSLAIELTRALLNTQPERFDALAVLVRSLIYRSYSDYNRAGDRDAALQFTTEAVTRSPSNLDFAALHAFALQAAGQPVTAAEVAERVLDVQPDHALARAALGLAYGGVGSYQIALREALRAVQSEGWAVDTRRALAIAHSDVGDYESALRVVDQAIRIHERLTPLYFERALYAMQRGDQDKATVAYFQILAYDSGNAKARLRLCELSSLLRERDAALDYCQQVVDLAPTWADAWFTLGREYFLQGDFAAARDHLHRCSALQVMQNVPVEERRFECWYLQGQAAEILGDCESLVATYNEFRAMSLTSTLQQTWSFPPEGPPDCTTPVSP